MASRLNSRAEYEMNLNWAEKYPELFVKAVVDFQTKYANPDWKITINMDRSRFVKLIATRAFND